MFATNGQKRRGEHQMHQHHK